MINSAATAQSLLRKNPCCELIRIGRIIRQNFQHWADAYVIFYYTHCLELMKSVVNYGYLCYSWWRWWSDIFVRDFKIRLQSHLLSSKFLSAILWICCYIKNIFVMMHTIISTSFLLIRFNASFVQCFVHSCWMNMEKFALLFSYLFS
jgi:hypothetical protein